MRTSGPSDPATRVGRRVLLALVLGACIPVFYSLTGHLIAHLGLPLQDDALRAIDARFLGGLFPDGQVSFWIDRSDLLGPHTLIGRVLTEIFQVAYFSYYVWGYGLLIILLVRLKRGTDPRAWTHLKMFLTAWVGAYVLNYACYVIVPAMGPWVAYAAEYVHPLEGLVLTQPIRELIGPNQVTPDCFPSGHAAISWIVAIAGLRLAPRWGRAALVAAILITLATLGLRYHYVVDLVAAVPLCLVGLWWGGFLGGARTSRCTTVPFGSSSSS